LGADFSDGASIVLFESEGRIYSGGALQEQSDCRVPRQLLEGEKLLRIRRRQRWYEILMLS
jgi:hypothetical protein